MLKYVMMNEELIAPCGMNCGLCSSYLALRFDLKTQGIRMPYCAGCRPRNKQCAFLKKRCDSIKDNHIKFCYECADYPCAGLSRLDHRYQTLFRMSMLDNLEYIRKDGMNAFLNSEKTKWKCPSCGDIICCHNGICFNCGIEELKAREKLYRWE